MPARLSLAAALLFFPPLALPGETPKAPPTPAEKALQVGQTAMDGDRFDEAIDQFQLAIRLDPKLVQAHLNLAAAYLALGNDRLAAPSLAAYLNARPDHFLVRMPYAEVLTRLEQFGAACTQMERFVVDVQDFPRLADEHLLPCHTRLMELAQKLGDEYGERLNRGIGLYLLAIKRVELGGEKANHLAEELLCKAAAELTLARLQRPDEARPSWYLHGVWNRLGQRQPAERSLRAAEQLAGLSYLSPVERRHLHLAASLRVLEQQKR
jgi:tetratricopeptide (TPR) repeat protein